LRPPNRRGQVNWGGKAIGGALGMLVLGPIGAAVGVVIGHQFDSGQMGRNLLGGPADPGLVNELFFPSTFRVMGHIAKADGYVSEQEIASARAVMHALHLNAQQIQAAIGYFTEGKQPAFDLDTLLTRLGASLAPYPELAHFFIEMQLQAALAGNGLSAIPRARLQRVATMLGVNSYDFSRLESFLRFRHGAPGGYGPGAGAYRDSSAGGAGTGAGAGSGAAGAPGGAERLAQAYSMLEATVTLSDEEIVKCYRRQMSRHHPDKLKANGLPESMLERAKERTQQIQAAYELIRERRGMR
jgi:DnaJ like chaperone protein